MREGDLKKIVKTLTALKKDFNAIARTLPKKEGGFVFKIDGQSKFDRAVGVIREYMGNIQKGITTAKDNSEVDDTE